MVEKILDKETVLKGKTKKSFGYQWRIFKEMSCDFEKNFLNYIYPVDKAFFKGKTGLDAGCGFGRHIYYAARYGARMVGLDASEAIKSSKENTEGMKNIFLIQGDIYEPPLKRESLDFVYSIGVLHHLPSPEKAFQTLVKLIKPGGVIFIWVYSKNRKITNLIIEMGRSVTRKLPLKPLKYLSLIFALIDWIFFIQPYRILRLIPALGRLADRITFERIKIYSTYPFQVTWADWFDRLSAPIRFYYDQDELVRWLQKADLVEMQVSPTGKYGWRVYGRKKSN